MPQSNLLELTYFDPKAQVRLTTYADTIITEPNGREESLAAVRFGGYPEMVRAMSDAIYGGGTVDLIQNGNTFHLKSKPKSYQRHMSHDGTYATATILFARMKQNCGKTAACMSFPSHQPILERRKKIESPKYLPLLRRRDPACSRAAGLRRCGGEASEAEERVVLPVPELQRPCGLPPGDSASSRQRGQ